MTKELTGVISKFVRDGFVTCSGITLSHSFLDPDYNKNPFKTLVGAPVFYIFRANEKNHLEIRYFKDSRKDISFTENMKRLHGEAPFSDLSCFLMVPFDVEMPGNLDKKLKIERGFVRGDPGKHKEDIYLIYFNEIENTTFYDRLDSVQTTRDFSLKNFLSWINRSNKIFFYAGGSKEIPLGKVKIPEESSKDLSKNIYGILKEKYGTSLLFDI